MTGRMQLETKVQFGTRLSQPLARTLRKASIESDLMLSELIARILAEWLKARYPEVAKNPKD